MTETYNLTKLAADVAEIYPAQASAFEQGDQVVWIEDHVPFLRSDLPTDPGIDRGNVDRCVKPTPAPGGNDGYAAH